MYWCIDCEQYVEHYEHEYPISEDDYQWCQNPILVSSKPPEMTEEEWNIVFQNEPSDDEMELINREAQEILEYV